MVVLYVLSSNEYFNVPKSVEPALINACSLPLYVILVLGVGIVTVGVTLTIVNCPCFVPQYPLIPLIVIEYCPAFMPPSFCVIT